MSVFEHIGASGVRESFDFMGRTLEMRMAPDLLGCRKRADARPAILAGAKSMIASLKQAFRSLRKSPAFALTVIATLGIGIGLNAAIFTVVDNVLLRPLGFHEADRIVALRTHFDKENRSIYSLGGDDYNDIAREVKGLQATAYFQAWPDGIRLGSAAVYLPVAMVSPRFAEVMGVEPLAGRVFNGGDRDGHDALVSAAFARDHFGSVEAALNQTLRHEGVISTIVGVLPDGFSFPGKTAVWLEAPAEPEVSNRTAYNQQAIGRRAAGTTPEQLAAELGTFSKRLQGAYVEDRLKSLESVSLQERIVGRIRPTLMLLMGSVAIILLIVCANIAHLQLVRSSRQMRAVSIRTALGASRTTLGLHALAETVLLATAGSVVALALAVPALKLLILIAPPEVPRLTDVRLNVDVLFFSFLVSVLVMVVTALLPIWRSWQVDPASALRQDVSRGTETRSSLRLRNGLIVAEVAFTLALSVSALLVTRQLISQSREDLGFSSESLVTLDTHAISPLPPPARPKGNSPEEAAAYKTAHDAAGTVKLLKLQETLDTLSAVPGVDAAEAILGAPMGFGGSDVSYAVKGRSVFAPPFLNLPNADLRPVTPGLMATMRIPMLQGRGLNTGDRMGAPTVLLINQALARAIFPGQDPVGQQIMCGYDSALAWWTIVGVVGDIHGDSPGAPPTPTFYVPVAQHPGGAGDMQLVVRTKSDPAAMAKTLEARLRQTHPEIAVKATTMRENIGNTQRSQSFRTVLFAAFAGVSILLAAIGMYGVTAYTVAQRRFEFGLRVALGANRTQLLTLVLRGALWVTLLGVALGTALALSLQRILGSVIGKLPAFDGVAYAMACGLVLLLAFVATMLPARRAAGTDPMDVLRSE